MKVLKFNEMAKNSLEVKADFLRDVFQELSDEGFRVKVYDNGDNHFGNLYNMYGPEKDTVDPVTDLVVVSVHPGLSENFTDEEFGMIKEFNERVVMDIPGFHWIWDASNPKANAGICLYYFSK